jgi:hypothetical protein
LVAHYLLCYLEGENDGETMKNRFFITLGLSLFLAQASACGGSLQPDPSPNPMTPTSMQFVIPTVTAALTSKPATITPPPLPTMLPEERETHLLEYFNNPGECKLPCWLGITPGITAFSEFQVTIQQLGLRHSPATLNLSRRQKVELGGLDYESKQVLNDITLIVEPGGVISEIEGILHAYLNPANFSETWNTLDIKQILLDYGTPSSISILTDYNDAAGRVGYSIQVYYTEQGFAVYYGGGTDYQSVVNICPHLKDYQLITIAFSLQAPPFEEKADSPQGFYTELKTEFDIDELYALFTDQTGSCLKVPSDAFR